MTPEPGPTKAEALEDAPDVDLGALEGELARGHGRFDLRLKKIIGYGGVGALVTQIVVGNVVFIIYAGNNGWDVPAAAISAWLAACVIQVAVIVRTITSYIFPADTKPTGAGVSKG